MSGAIATDSRALADGDFCWWAALAVAAAWLVWPLLTAVGSGGNAAVAYSSLAAAPATRSNKPMPVSAADAAGWRWFGFDDTSARPAPVVKAEDTRLNLQLIGVATGSDAKTSLALVRINGQVASYGVGARLPVSGNVRIMAVAHDRILLNHDGKREQLLLYQFGDGNGNNTASEPSHTPQAESGGPDRTAPARRNG